MQCPQCNAPLAGPGGCACGWQPPAQTAPGQPPPGPWQHPAGAQWVGGQPGPGAPHYPAPGGWQPPPPPNFRPQPPAAPRGPLPAGLWAFCGYVLLLYGGLMACLVRYLHIRYTQLQRVSGYDSNPLADTLMFGLFVGALATAVLVLMLWLVWRRRAALRTVFLAVSLVGTGPVVIMTEFCVLFMAQNSWGLMADWIQELIQWPTFLVFVALTAANLAWCAWLYASPALRRVMPLRTYRPGRPGRPGKTAPDPKTEGAFVRFHRILVLAGVPVCALYSAYMVQTEWFEPPGRAGAGVALFVLLYGMLCGFTVLALLVRRIGLDYLAVYTTGTALEIVAVVIVVGFTLVGGFFASFFRSNALVDDMLGLLQNPFNHLFIAQLAAKMVWQGKLDAGRREAAALAPRPVPPPRVYPQGWPPAPPYANVPAGAPGPFAPPYANTPAGVPAPFLPPYTNAPAGAPAPFVPPYTNAPASAPGPFAPPQASMPADVSGAFAPPQANMPADAPAPPAPGGESAPNSTPPPGQPG